MRTLLLKYPGCAFVPSKMTVTVPFSPGRTTLRVYFAEVHWQEGATLSNTAGTLPLFSNVNECSCKGVLAENVPKLCMLSANEIRAEYVSGVFFPLPGVPLHEPATPKSNKHANRGIDFFVGILMDGTLKKAPGPVQDGCSLRFMNNWGYSATTSGLPTNVPPSTSFVQVTKAMFLLAVLATISNFPSFSTEIALLITKVLSCD